MNEQITSLQFQQHWFLSFPVPGDVYHPLSLHVWRTAQEISKQMKDTWPRVVVRGDLAPEKTSNQRDLIAVFSIRAKFPFTKCAKLWLGRRLLTGFEHL